MKKLVSTIHGFLHLGAGIKREDEFDFEDVLAVEPTELYIPIDLNEEEHYSCSIQLTNKTGRIVGYYLESSWGIDLVSPDEDTYVGIMSRRSTSSVPLTAVKLGKKTPPMKLWNKPPPENKPDPDLDEEEEEEEWIDICAHVVKDGVKAEDITCREDLLYLTDKPAGLFRMPVFYYYTVVPAANSSSAVVLEENEKRISLLNDHDNPFQPSNNKEMQMVENSPPPAELVIPITGGGYGSTSQRKSEDTRVKPSFKAFSSEEIQDATNNFSESLIIEHGGYGKVYKCQLDNWDVVVKILDDKGDQGLKEYIKEMEVLEGMRHENLIHLMGTCFKLRALVYEYLPKGSLEDCLKDTPLELTWEIRTRIVYEICTALRFLHAKRPEPLVHGDLKPHNVLLDANFKVKLADFGLCRYLTQGKNSKAFHNTLNISGSAGYIDPDYLGSGKVTPGVDVYSFGKTVVRILTGRYPPDIFSVVHAAKKTRSFKSIVDHTVRDWPEDVVSTLAHFALRSIKSDRNCSAFMENFYSELKKILDGIDS